MNTALSRSRSFTRTIVAVALVVIATGGVIAGCVTQTGAGSAPGCPGP